MVQERVEGRSGIGGEAGGGERGGDGGCEAGGGERGGDEGGGER